MRDLGREVYSGAMTKRLKQLPMQEKPFPAEDIITVENLLSCPVPHMFRGPSHKLLSYDILVGESYVLPPTLSQYSHDLLAKVDAEISLKSPPGGKGRSFMIGEEELGKVCQREFCEMDLRSPESPEVVFGEGIGIFDQDTAAGSEDQMRSYESQSGQGQGPSGRKGSVGSETPQGRGVVGAGGSPQPVARQPSGNSPSSAPPVGTRSVTPPIRKLSRISSGVRGDTPSGTAPRTAGNAPTAPGQSMKTAVVDSQPRLPSPGSVVKTGAPTSVQRATASASIPRTGALTSVPRASVPASFQRTGVAANVPRTSAPGSFPRTGAPTFVSRTVAPTSVSRAGTPSNVSRAGAPTSTPRSTTSVNIPRVPAKKTSAADGGPVAAGPRQLLRSAGPRPFRATAPRPLRPATSKPSLQPAVARGSPGLASHRFAASTPVVSEPSDMQKATSDSCAGSTSTTTTNTSSTVSTSMLTTVSASSAVSSALTTPPTSSHVAVAGPGKVPARSAKDEWEMSARSRQPQKRGADIVEAQSEVGKAAAVSEAKTTATEGSKMPNVVINVGTTITSNSTSSDKGKEKGGGSEGVSWSSKALSSGSRFVPPGLTLLSEGSLQTKPAVSASSITDTSLGGLEGLERSQGLQVATHRTVMSGQKRPHMPENTGTEVEPKKALVDSTVWPLRSQGERRDAHSSPERSSIHRPWQNLDAGRGNHPLSARDHPAAGREPDRFRDIPAFDRAPDTPRMFDGRDDRSNVRGRGDHMEGDRQEMGIHRAPHGDDRPGARIPSLLERDIPFASAARPFDARVSEEFLQNRNNPRPIPVSTTSHFDDFRNMPLDLSEPRRLQDRSEQRRMQDMSEQRRMQDMSEQRRMQDMSEQRRMQDMSEQRRLQEISERRLQEISEQRRLQDLSVRDAFSLHRVGSVGREGGIGLDRGGVEGGIWRGPLQRQLQHMRQQSTWQPLPLRGELRGSLPGNWPRGPVLPSEAHRGLDLQPHMMDLRFLRSEDRDPRLPGDFRGDMIRGPRNFPPTRRPFDF